MKEVNYAVTLAANKEEAAKHILGIIGCCN